MGVDVDTNAGRPARQVTVWENPAEARSLSLAPKPGSPAGRDNPGDVKGNTVSVKCFPSIDEAQGNALRAHARGAGGAAKLALSPTPCSSNRGGEFLDRLPQANEAAAHPASEATVRCPSPPPGRIPR